MNYGNKIAELRKSKNLTQADLGKRLNVTAQAVSKWENDLSEPDIDSIKKLCGIFEISVDAFLDSDANENVLSQEKENPSPQTDVKIINGYCESCNAPVGPGEYKVEHLSYSPYAIGEKVKKSEAQHIYCNKCHEKLLKDKITEEKKRAAEKAMMEKEKDRREFFRGIIWGTAIAVAIFFITFLCLSKADILSTLYPLLIVLTIGAFTLVSQLFWGSEILPDIFFFFCHSFKAPFGLIFHLDLDGIIWFIAVKLILWILCTFLSLAFFALGLVICTVWSYFSFPFAFGKKIRTVSNKNVD